MIKNLFGLYRAQTKAGRDCLKGKLLRDLVLVDPESGHESRYPAGSLLMLLKNDRRRSDTSPEYHVAIICDDDDAEPQRPSTPPTPRASRPSSPPESVDPSRVRAANAHDAEHMGENYIPY
jgi:hypothetical protein